MDASLQARAEQLASEMAGEARTIEDINGLMRLMMKSALERMLNTEMDVHLGRRPAAVLTEESAAGNDASDRAVAVEASSIEAAEEISQSPQRPIEKDGPQRNGRTDDRHATGPGRHVRAEVIGKHQRRVPGLRRKDPRAVRQGDDDSRHPGDRAGPVRRGRFRPNWFGNHRRSGCPR